MLCSYQCDVPGGGAYQEILTGIWLILQGILTGVFWGIACCHNSEIKNHNTCIWDVCFKNDTDLHSLHTESIGEMNKKIIGKWSESVNDEDKWVGMQVLELCIERDSLNDWVFDRREIFDIVNFVCII